MVIKVACLSRIERTVKSWLLNSSGSDVGGCGIRSDEAKSLLIVDDIDVLVRRKVNSELGVEVWV